MRILKNELKKLITIKNILIIMLITFIGYKQSIIPWSQINDGVDIVKDVSLQMIKDYGNELDVEEFKDFKEEYNKKVKIAEEYMNSNRDFTDAGIYDYDEYYKITRNSGEEKYQSTELQDLYYKYLYHEDMSMFRELNELENRIITYEHDILENEIYHASEKLNNNTEYEDVYKQREKELIESEQYMSIFPYNIFERYDAQIRALARIIIISIVIVISTIYIFDKNNKVEYIQYSSKYGRKLFKTKILAGLIMIFIMTTIQLMIFFKYYSTQNIGLFLDCYISGQFNFPVMSWYDLTFRDYIGVTIIGIYLISFIIGIISMYVSSKAKTYMSLLGIQIPIILFMNIFGLKYLINNMTSMYYTINRLGTVNVPKYTLESVFIILLITSISIMYIRSKKEIKAEIN